jgi:hypothetical protein
VEGFRKAVVYFAEPAKPIGPIPLVQGGKVRALQNLRYTAHDSLLKAKIFDDGFAADDGVASDAQAAV